METTTSEVKRVELTKPEINKLKKMVLGYGNFKATARKVPELHKNTLRNVIDKGRGSHDAIELIRQSLLK